MQDIGHYSPLRSGLAYLPFGIAMLAAIQLSIRLLPRVSIKYSLVAAFLLCAAGTLLLGQTGDHMQYATHVLPATIMYGFAQGHHARAAVRRPARNRSGRLRSGQRPADTTLQIGGSLGLAALVTVALRHAASVAQGSATPLGATVDGYVLAFRIGAAALLAGAVLIAVAFQHINAASPRPAPSQARREEPRCLGSRNPRDRGSGADPGPRAAHAGGTRQPASTQNITSTERNSHVRFHRLTA